MLGIILSLLATLLALSFAFHTDDWSRQHQKIRRGAARQFSKSLPQQPTQMQDRAEKSKDADLNS
jgi:hypothetical protein